MAKFCKKCGSPLNDQATFCPKCGAPVGASPAPAPGPGAYRPAPGPVRGPGGGPLDLSTNAGKFKLGVFITGALVILSAFLTYASAVANAYGYTEKESVSLIEGGDGWFFLACAAVAIVGVVIGKEILPLVGGVIAALLSIYEFIDAKSQLSDADELRMLEAWGVKFDISMGIGCYLNIIASIALAVFGVLLFLEARKNR